MNSTTALKVFVSYAHKDESLKDEFVAHLALLKREGLIAEWHDRKIVAGQEWETEISSNLRSAELILLLVSPDFLASDYCFGKELTVALERHESREAAVVPIVVRPSDWKRAPFARLQALPKDGKPITTWSNRDEAWLDVSSGIRTLISHLRTSLVVRKKTKTVFGIQELLAQEFERIDHRYHQESACGGIATGFPDCDELIDGLHPGDLVVIAARPNMGRGDFALGLVKSTAVDQRLPAVLFSLRIGIADVTRKLTAAVSQVSDANILRARLDDSDWSQLTAAVSQLHDAPLSIDGSPQLSIADLSERCGHLKKEFGELGLVVVDGIEQIELDMSDKSRDGATIPRALKKLAQDLHVPIVVTTDVLPVVETRPNKRPVLRDIERWEQLEESADVIAFLFRDEIYNPDTEDQNIAEFCLAKNTRGPVETVRLVYRQHLSRFDSIADAAQADARKPPGQT